MNDQHTIMMRAIADSLRRLKAAATGDGNLPEFHPAIGICGNFGDIFMEGARAGRHPYGLLRDARIWMEAQFWCWPLFSGCGDFPVQVEGSALGPRANYFDHLNKWDTSTEYGRLRHELLDFLIERAEQAAEEA